MAILAIRAHWRWVLGAAAAMALVGLVVALVMWRDRNPDVDVGASDTSGSSDPAAGDDEAVASDHADGVDMEVIEPDDALVSSVGEGWVLQDRWFVEANTSVETNCPSFDSLAEIDDRGGTRSVWSNGTSRLTQRVASLDLAVGDYVSTARSLADACPVIETEAGDLRVSPIALEDGVGCELSAFPVPDPAFDGRLPELETSAGAWVVTLHRGSVISVLTIESNGDLDLEDVAAFADLAMAQLEAAPSHTVRAAPTPTPVPQEPRTVEEVTLTLDAECRNGGSVTVDGITWEVNQPAPHTWVGRDQQNGRPAISDDLHATFIATDDKSVSVTTGDRSAECIRWVDD